MQHDVLREAGPDAGDAGQQRCRRSVDVDADRIHAVLDHGVERARQLVLADIVLVLADADRFRINLDKLSEGILQAARDRYGAAQGHVEAGQLGRGIGGGGIDRGAGLGDHDLRHLQVGQEFDQLGRELVGLARGGAVADRDQFDVVLLGEFAEDGERLVPLTLRLVRIDHRGRDHLAGRIDHRDLDAGAVAGIETHGGAGARRGREQQVAQIGSEHADRFLLGRLPQPHPQIDAEMDLDLGAPGPARRVHQPLVGRTATVADAEAVHDPQLVDARTGRCRRRILRLERDAQDFFLLSPEQRQDAVGRHLGELLGEIEVVAELGAGFLLAVAHLGGEAAGRPHLLAQRADQVGVLGKTLHQDGACAIERSGGIGDLLVSVDVACRRSERVVLRMRQQHVRERLEARLLGDLGLGAALRLERQIDIFEATLAVCGADRGFERVVELALLADRVEDDGAPLLQLAQVAQALVEGAQLGIVERAGRFLAVAGDEGNRCAAVEQLHGGCDLLCADAELLRDPLVYRSRQHAPIGKISAVACDEAAARSGAGIWTFRD